MEIAGCVSNWAGVSGAGAVAAVKRKVVPGKRCTPSVPITPVVRVTAITSPGLKSWVGSNVSPRLPLPLKTPLINPVCSPHTTMLSSLRSFGVPPSTLDWSIGRSNSKVRFASLGMLVLFRGGEVVSREVLDAPARPKIKLSKFTLIPTRLSSVMLI